MLSRGSKVNKCRAGRDVSGIPPLAEGEMATDSILKFQRQAYDYYTWIRSLYQVIRVQVVCC
jgi:hypothetical protein